MKKSIKLEVKETTLSTKLDQFINNCKVRGLSQATLYNYEHTVTMFIDVTGETLDVDKFILYLRSRGNNNTSINTRIKALKAFFKYAKIDVECPKLKSVRNHKAPYSEGEIKLLLAKPKLNSYSQWRNHAIVSTLLATGIRCRTLLNLKISDVDFVNNLIFLNITKTNKKYSIPMSSTLKATLKHYLGLYAHDDDDYLFVSLYGDQLTRDSLKQTIRDYNLKRGVSKTSIHLFRHTFAINYLKNGGNIMYLQQILGHSNLETTRLYLYINEEDLKNDFDSLCPLDNVKKKGIQIKKTRV